MIPIQISPVELAAWSAAMIFAGAVLAALVLRRQARREAEKDDFSKLQLEAFFEHAPVGLALHDLEGRYLYASSLTQAVYGMSEDDLKNRTMQSLSHLWPDAEEIEQTMLKVSQGEIRRLLKPLNSPGEAEPLYFDVIMFPIRNAAGTIVQIGALGSDVTALMRAEAARVEREAQLRSLFEHVPAQIMVFDREHRTVMANQSAADLHFMRSEEMIGKLPPELSAPWEDFDIFYATGVEVLETGQPRRFQPVYRHPETGATSSWDAMFFPIMSDEREVEQVGLFLFDITRQKAAERALEEQIAQAHQSEKLAALGQLLAGVAHELNNPLTVVVGRSAILEEKLQDTPHVKALAEIRQAADRCGRIVKTFLAMARQSEPHRRAVAINNTIEAALEMMAYTLRSGGVQVSCDFDPALPAVQADEDQLIQVFTNLIVNAGHALDQFDGPRELRVRTRREGTSVIAEIADSGPGVAEDLVSRIFEPFFTTKVVGEGTGMGLALAKGVIDEHGGSLGYHPAPGGGAVFTVSLPAQPAIVTAATDQPEPGPAIASDSLSRARVLIVDDEEPIRGMLAEILRRVNIDSVGCGNGAEAVELMRTDCFDLIFCDVRMPVMDGVRLRRHIAETEPAMLERLIFMSGDVLQRSGERYAPLAAHSIIDKPFRPAEARAIALAALEKVGIRSTQS